MARDNTLLTLRNQEIRAAYNRLIAEEVIAVYRGRRVAMRLNYEQVMTMLGRMFYLSPRTIEPIITATAPKMADIKTEPDPVSTAQAA
jgi:hypothetical protein